MGFYLNKIYYFYNHIFTNMSKLTEVDVGITENLHQGQGCGGVIKMRFSDFIVNEVDLEGKQVHFDSKCWNTTLQDCHEKVEAKKDAVDDALASLEEREEILCAGLPSEHKHFTDEEIILLAKLSVNKKDKKGSVDILIDGIDKKERTAIHAFVRDNFPGLESRTLKNDDDKPIIRCLRYKQGGNKRARKFAPDLMYKENIATMDAINLICKKLRLNNIRSFAYAGTKDKRGCTTQEVTTSIPPQRLLGINKMLQNIRVGNFQVCEDQMRLGDLTGNYFTIILRDIDDNMKHIKQSCNSLTSNGFINYFGMQRFGCGKVPTYEVGKALISSNWKKAIDLVLTQVHESCDKVILEKLMTWDEGANAMACVGKLGRRSMIENNLMKGISRCGVKQLTQALCSIPRNIRLMYLHSYQSFVWNRMVSRRIKEFGLKVVVGDIVQIGSDAVRHEGPSAKRRRKLENQEEDDVADARYKRISEDDDLSLYNISQVVLPLPGCDVKYPHYGTECWYKQIAEVEDGVNMEHFDHSVKDYFLPGAYRKIVGSVKDLKYEIIKYNDFTKPLVATDKDLHEGRDIPKVKDGKFAALKISFQLPTSAYATVALRDVTMTDLCPNNQTVIGDKHKLESMELMGELEEDE